MLRCGSVAKAGETEFGAWSRFTCIATCPRILLKRRARILLCGLRFACDSRRLGIRNPRILIGIACYCSVLLYLQFECEHITTSCNPTSVMDVLEANFPHAVSLTVAAANYEDVLSLPTSHNPRACANPAIIWNPGVTKGKWRERWAPKVRRADASLDEETKGRPPQACGQMFLDEVIINLRWAGTLVVMSNDPEILDFARAYLENECQKLRRLYQDPILFETDDARAAFFRRVAKQLNSIMEINSSWTDLESSLKESEAAACGVTMREMDLAQAADSNDAWVQPCSNSVHFPSRPIMQQALDKGTTLLTCEQYLPRGGPWIMLRWQKKVDSIVESILQVSSSVSMFMSSVLFHVSRLTPQADNR